VFICESAVVRKERYGEVLVCLHESVCPKHPEMSVVKDWVLLHDCASTSAAVYASLPIVNSWSCTM
jgi:hypothetical protein